MRTTIVIGLVLCCNAVFAASKTPEKLIPGEVLYKKAGERLSQEVPSVMHYVREGQMDPKTLKLMMFPKLIFQFNVRQGLCQKYVGLLKTHAYTYTALIEDSADPSKLCNQQTAFKSAEQALYGVEVNDEFSINGRTFRLIQKGEIVSIARVTNRYRKLRKPSSTPVKAKK